MNNIFRIYKDVPNPMQLVLSPIVSSDLSSAKIEVFNFQKTKVFSFTVGNGITITDGKLHVSNELNNLKKGDYTLVLAINNGKSINPLIIKVM